MRRGRAARGPAASTKDPDSAEAAYADALRRLARQPQSRAMLSRKLAQAGYAQPAIVAALDRAAAEGYLDDREYAEALVRRRSTSRGHALIAQELRSKGIADLLAEPALAQIDPELELARGLRLGRSLLAGRRLADGDSLLNYLAPKLARRGFSGGLVYRICRRLTDDYEAARLFDTKNDHN